MDWQAKLAWAGAEHERRLVAALGPDEREDLRLAGIAGASWAAGLAVAAEHQCGAAGKLGPADCDDPVPVDGGRP